MTIQFVIEDGTAKTDATSYATVAQYRQYWENRGVDYSSTPLESIEARLNLATEYIDSTYDFDGTRVDEDQALSWPRYDATDRHGKYIDYETIPQRLIDATCYLAAQDGLQFVDDGIKSLSYGGVSKTFGNRGKKFPVADKLLSALVIQGVKLVRVN